MVSSFLFTWLNSLNMSMLSILVKLSVESCGQIRYNGSALKPDSRTVTNKLLRRKWTWYLVKDLSKISSWSETVLAAEAKKDRKGDQRHASYSYAGVATASRSKKNL